jgi:hypothetical protein
LFDTFRARVTRLAHDNKFEKAPEATAEAIVVKALEAYLKGK